jgi:membrane-associated phospholipid phosphatase
LDSANSVNKEDVQRQEGVTVEPAGSPAVGTFDTIFGETIRDFRRLPSQDALKWIGIGAVAASIGRSIDQPVSRGLSTSPLLDDLFEPGETIGGARLQLGGALVTYAAGRLARSPKVTRVGADLLQAQIMSQALTTAVKMAVGRTRPDGTQYSFPSGHASVTFASATVLQRDLGWKFGLPAYGVATYVAASRIQEKRHYLSDVAFGAAIGILAGRTVTVGRGDGRFAVAPVAAPGGGGVSFTWVGR